MYVPCPHTRSFFRLPTHVGHLLFVYLHRVRHPRATRLHRTSLLASHCPHSLTLARNHPFDFCVSQLRLAKSIYHFCSRVPDMGLQNQPVISVTARRLGVKPSHGHTSVMTRRFRYCKTHLLPSNFWCSYLNGHLNVEGTSTSGCRPSIVFDSNLISFRRLFVEDFQHASRGRHGPLYC